MYIVYIFINRCFYMYKTYLILGLSCLVDDFKGGYTKIKPYFISVHTYNIPKNIE